MTLRSDGHTLGLHRVISPEGALPQSAEKLDALGPAFDNEIVIDVKTLNVDSASFHQIVGDVGPDPEAIARRVKAIVATRGKMQNPVTGSGGMLLGTVRSVGPAYDGATPVHVGDRIATLVSLTLTPLHLERIDAVRLDSDQLDVHGTAYLWPSAPIVVLPEDLPERLALAALDVCGAPAQARRLAQGCDRVLLLGAGKSGMLCAAAVRDVLGDEALVAAFDRDEATPQLLLDEGLVDAFACGDARRPTEVLEAVLEMSGGEPYDLVINTCNVPDTEMAAILPCRDRGKVYLFNMASDFARAALGAEGCGKDVDLLIGNGYARDHAAYTLELVRRHPALHRAIAPDA